MAVSHLYISLTGLLPSSADLPRSFCYIHLTLYCRALPLSLAATREIDVSFSSCRYLDGSVPCVPFCTLFYSDTDDSPSAAGLPHSDICASCGYVHLNAAFRSLSRPSSAPDAKAFSLCSCLLFLRYITILLRLFDFLVCDRVAFYLFCFLCNFQSALRALL